MGTNLERERESMLKETSFDLIVSMQSPFIDSLLSPKIVFFGPQSDTLHTFLDPNLTLFNNISIDLSLDRAQPNSALC